MNDWSGAFYRDLDLRYANGDQTRVEEFLIREEEHLRNIVGENWKLALVYNELGSLYRGSGYYQKSLEAFQKARELGRDCMEPGEYATILNNMAGTLRLMGEYGQAEGLFLEAIRWYEESGLADTAAYASVLNNLSLVYQATRQLDKAIHYLERALTLIEAMPERRQELAVTYNNLTALYHAAGDDKQALRCANRALTEYEKLPEDERSHYAAVLNSLAGFLYGKGDYTRALELYRKSARYTRRFFGENEEYGITCQNMRWVYEKLGDRKGAAACLRRADRVYRKLFGPDHIRTRTVEDDLARMNAVRF